jgi:hypothetical protein
MGQNAVLFNVPELANKAIETGKIAARIEIWRLS